MIKKNFLKLFTICLFISFVFLGKNVYSNELQQHEKSNRITFTDLSNRKIEIDGPVNRIFLGFYEESYLAVAENFDKVVSISKGEWADFFNDQYNAYEKQMPEIAKIIDTGSIYKGSFSMETLLNSKPQVAIVAPFQYETLAENIDKLEKSGIKVIVIDYNSQTLENHIKSTKILGKITGNEKRAEELIRNYENALNEVKERVENIKNRKKVYIELGNLGADQIGNSYGNYLWGSLVKLAGGNNIAENKIDSYGPLSPEYILTSNPDTIFFAGANWANDAGNRVLIGFNVSPEQTWKRLTPYTKRTGWKKLNAIKNGEIYAVNHGGLRSIYDYVYVQYIAKSLYPELFEDIDPKENLENFYKKYLPITPEGTFMTKYNKK
ncbi:ABC transporter substrate-binding protein [Fusobacterium varium]|uniref:ABC transporter substrate-binding protein n=1 Tax=Fusobacterium varium TaxID=856 RepID=UPI0025969639|nr:ABC transporter substrate-binding protein [uncultured Fusobacterium sp.]